MGKDERVVCFVQFRPVNDELKRGVICISFPSDRWRFLGLPEPGEDIGTDSIAGRLFIFFVIFF